MPDTIGTIGSTPTWGMEWLEATPQAAYSMWLKNLMGSPAMKKYMENQYSPFYNQYQGNVANTLMGGTIPTQTFLQFLGQQSPQREYSNLPNYMRGYFPATFAPRSRWMIW